MEWVLYWTVAAIIEFVKTFLFLYCALDFKISKNYLRHIFCIVIYCVTVNFLFSVNHISSDATGAYEWLNIIIPILCFDEKVLKKIFSHILAYLGVTTVDALILSISLVISNEIWEVVYQKMTIQRILINSVGILIWIFVGIVRKRILNKQEKVPIQKKYYIIVILYLIINAFVIGATQAILIDFVNEKVEKLLIISITVAGVVSVVLSFVLVKTLNSRNYYKQLNDINNEYFRMQGSYYQKVYENQQNLKAFRHDLNSHIICIKELANEGDMRGLNDYIDQILKQKEQFSANVYSGNKIVDAVISDIISQNMNNGINIVFRGSLPEKLNILPYDLCTIFSNVVKNAVEACLKLDNEIEKRIDISVNIYKNNIGILIINPIKEEVTVKNGKLLTSKKDKEWHGFGIENMKRAVKKYEGDIQFKSQDGKFMTDILLVNPIKD